MGIHLIPIVTMYTQYRATRFTPSRRLAYLQKAPVVTMTRREMDSHYHQRRVDAGHRISARNALSLPGTRPLGPDSSAKWSQPQVQLTKEQYTLGIVKAMFGTRPDLEWTATALAAFEAAFMLSTTEDTKKRIKMCPMPKKECWWDIEEYVDVWRCDTTSRPKNHTNEIYAVPRHDLFFLECPAYTRKEKITLRLLVPPLLFVPTSAQMEIVRFVVTKSRNKEEIGTSLELNKRQFLRQKDKDKLKDIQARYYFVSGIDLVNDKSDDDEYASDSEKRAACDFQIVGVLSDAEKAHMYRIRGSIGEVVKNRKTMWPFNGYPISNADLTLGQCVAGSVAEALGLVDLDENAEFSGTEPEELNTHICEELETRLTMLETAQENNTILAESIPRVAKHVKDAVLTWLQKLTEQKKSDLPKLIEETKSLLSITLKKAGHYCPPLSQCSKNDDGEDDEENEDDKAFIVKVGNGDEESDDDESLQSDDDETLDVLKKRLDMNKKRKREENGTDDDNTSDDDTLLGDRREELLLAKRKREENGTDDDNTSDDDVPLPRRRKKPKLAKRKIWSLEVYEQSLSEEGRAEYEAFFEWFFGSIDAQ